MCLEFGSAECNDLSSWCWSHLQSTLIGFAALVPRAHTTYLPKGPRRGAEVRIDADVFVTKVPEKASDKIQIVARLVGGVAITPDFLTSSGLRGVAISLHAATKTPRQVYRSDGFLASRPYVAEDIFKQRELVAFVSQGDMGDEELISNNVGSIVLSPLHHMGSGMTFVSIEIRKVRLTLLNQGCRSGTKLSPPSSQALKNVFLCVWAASQLGAAHVHGLAFGVPCLDRFSHAFLAALWVMRRNRVEPQRCTGTFGDQEQVDARRDSDKPFCVPLSRREVRVWHDAAFLESS